MTVINKPLRVILGLPELYLQLHFTSQYILKAGIYSNNSALRYDPKHNSGEPVNNMVLEARFS
jgi:hypothetical protein